MTVSLEEMFAELEVRQSTWRWRLARPFRRAWHEYSPCELRRKVRWGVQRWRRGYSDCDVWSIDHYLATIIPPMMRQSARGSHGVPGHIAARHSDDPELRGPIPETAVQEWQGILEAVAAGFDAWMTLLETCPDETRRTELEQQWETGSRLLIEHFGAFWD